jgi:hypothetical protein
MIKYLFILVNAFTVFIYSLFGGDNGINLSVNIPKTIIAGQEVPIEIKVTKGSMSGFAKLQLELPEGLSLKELDVDISRLKAEEDLQLFMKSSRSKLKRCCHSCSRVCRSRWHLLDQGRLGKRMLN